jgi:DNA polymerase-3 subunit delta'
MVINNEIGEAIKIEQIRGLLDQNKLKPYFAVKRFFIIRNIENMTLEAANAFLKTLEEPSDNSVLILTTSAPEKNLDTVKSRCHMIHFPSSSRNDLVNQLRTKYQMKEQESHFVAYYSQGCLGTALKLSSNHFIDKKNEFIDTFILNRPQDSSIKEVLEDKEETKQFLDVLSSWIRDALLSKGGVENERLIHLDRIDDLNQFVKGATFEELTALNRSTVKMHQLLADNLNIKLPLLIIGEQLWEK